VCSGGVGGGVGEGVVRAKSIRVDGCMVVCLGGGDAVCKGVWGGCKVNRWWQVLAYVCEV